MRTRPSVAADRLIVELHRGNDNFTVVGFDDVHNVARLGSFVLMPVQANYVVAEVIGLWEKDPISSRFNDASGSDMDKAASAKYLDLTPIGMLRSGTVGSFEFGVSVFPPLYADALYARDEDLDRIFHVADPMSTQGLVDREGTIIQGIVPQSIEVGTSVVFRGYPVKVRIDEFLGGHVAVLGNTGSGKSCTVATILQSLFDRPAEFAARGASFLILDVNGEYRPAFRRLPLSIGKRYLRADIDPSSAAPEPDDSGVEHTAVFRLPHWFMSVEEWELLLRASERTQQPVLRTALGLTSLFSDEMKDSLSGIKNHILAFTVISILQNDAGSPTKADRIKSLLSTFKTNEINLDGVRLKIAISFGQMADAEGLTSYLKTYVLESAVIPNYAHKSFPFEVLSSALNLALHYEEAHGNRQIRDFCSQMVTRLKWVGERDEFAFLRLDPKKLTLEELDPVQFVESLIGLERSGNNYLKTSQLTILDLNEAAGEVVEITAAVIARMIFERLRRASPRNQFPVHIILEEAHRYIAEKPSRYAIDVGRTFERIAKEGRKYGAFLQVASQRPSELSKTVLSQCSNFVVHRIQNPDDLAHIRQMTPFISDSVLRRLPSLPKQHALIFGSSVNIPTTFKARRVDPAPDSDDAKIRDIWFRPTNYSLPWIVPSDVRGEEEISDILGTDDVLDF